MRKLRIVAGVTFRLANADRWKVLAPVGVIVSTFEEELARNR